MDNITRVHRQFRQAFFTELGNFIDKLMKIWPDEAVDLTVYRALLRRTKPSDQEWFLDCSRYYIEPYIEKIRARDTSFFQENAKSALSEHEGTEYGNEAIQWFQKLKEMWREGKISLDQEEWVWEYINTFMELCLKEKMLRDKVKLKK